MYFRVIRRDTCFYKKLTTYILDEIKRMKDNNVDPLKECLHVFDHISTNSDTDKYMKGLLVFVHGSPCEGIY